MLKTSEHLNSRLELQVEDRWVHAARRLTSIESSFDPCNFTAIVPGAYTGEAKMCISL